MRDDLIGLILGCGCRKRCCCDEPPAPEPDGGGNLFAQSGRGTPPLRVPEETPFVPVVQSYDSPQRPSDWGQPRTSETGVFLGEGNFHPLQSWPRFTFYDDQGQPHAPGTAFAVDHDARQILQRADTVTHVSGLAADAVEFPWRARMALQPDELTFPPVIGNDIERSQGFIWFDPAPPSTRPGGPTTRTARERRLSFDGDLSTQTVGTTGATGLVYSGKFDVWYRRRWEATYSSYAPVEYRVRTVWTQTGLPDTPEFVLLKVADTEARIVLVDGEDWVNLNSVVRSYRSIETAMEAGFVQVGLTTRSVARLEEDQAGAPAVIPPPLTRFSSAGGAVSVAGPRNPNPANLNDDEGNANATLTAWGHALTGGSWAALRPHPTRLEDGSWEMGGAIVLHERGDTITAIQSTGTETCTRETFEREVLRCEPGAFRHFTDAGTLFTDWPQPWAMADCETEVRAVAAHEPWRDSVRRQAVDLPPSWIWPGRPAKPPRRVPPTAPRAPLGLTLAGVLTDAQDAEPLGYRQPPVLLPKQVEVWREGRWEVSEAALHALQKRILYQPSGWPEELDDRRSIRGRLRLRYPYDVPETNGTSRHDAVLLIRAKRRPGGLKVMAGGVSLPAHLLGHNAAEKRGWHAYAVEAGTLPPGPVVLTLDSAASVSRALLYVQITSVAVES